MTLMRTAQAMHVPASMGVCRHVQVLLLLLMSTHRSLPEAAV
jgi:hypothetical protein